ncbi:unnamed protein product [Camellia sinensis]
MDQKNLFEALTQQKFSFTTPNLTPLHLTTDHSHRLRSQRPPPQIATATAADRHRHCRRSQGLFEMKSSLGMLRRFALHKSHGKEKRDYQLSVHLYDLSQASQVLINQMKDVAPAIQNSITEVTEEVNSISSNLPPVTQHHGRSTSSIQAQSSGTTMESSNDEVADVTSRLSTGQLEKVSASPSALKLPSLFSATPNSLGKRGNMQKQQTLAQTSQMENMSERKSVDQLLSNNRIEYDRVNGFLSAAGSNFTVSDSQKSYCDGEEAQDHVFSPPSLMGSSFLGDPYEDLLAPLSETETALMER